jgi:hypothetical protein
MTFRLVNQFVGKHFHVEFTTANLNVIKDPVLFVNNQSWIVEDVKEEPEK